MPRKPQKGKSLAEVNPELAKQWHPTKNRELTPYDFTSGSDRKVWWKCDKGDDHEWEAIISSRNNGKGCSVCSCRTIVKSNCLATLNPILAKEWHPTKNVPLTTADVGVNSGKKVWWKCDQGDDHEWEASVSSRNNGNGCSICSGKIVVKSNCLQTLYPKLSLDWHPTKNGDLSPLDVTPGSAKKVWWKCDQGDDHEWSATVKSRVKGSGCSICRGLKLVKSNCLQTLYPKLSLEWHPTKNGALTPLDIFFGSSKKVWWKCDQGDDHEWETSVTSRTNGTGCPFCAGIKVSLLSSLASKNPILAKEWHPTKNGDLTPYDFTEHSNQQVWWKCDQGDDHEWEASINNRSTGKGCSICSGKTLVKSNCLQTLYPKLSSEWHPTKNGDLTPSDVFPAINKKVWWKCNEDDDHEWEASISSRTNGHGCPTCAEYGFDPQKISYFYIRDIKVNNKRALKFGVTNQLTGKREIQQKRGLHGSLETVFRVEIEGHLAIIIENECKRIYGKSGYLSRDELTDGYTETIQYSEENLNKIKSIVNKALKKN